jgi:hypothetical protein
VQFDLLELGFDICYDFLLKARLEIAARVLSSVSQCLSHPIVAIMFHVPLSCVRCHSVPCVVMACFALTIMRMERTMYVRPSKQSRSEVPPIVHWNNGTRLVCQPRRIQKQGNVLSSVIMMFITAVQTRSLCARRLICSPFDGLSGLYSALLQTGQLLFPSSHGRIQSSQKRCPHSRRTESSNSCQQAGHSVSARCAGVSTSISSCCKYRALLGRRLASEAAGARGNM